MASSSVVGRIVVGSIFTVFGLCVTGVLVAIGFLIYASANVQMISPDLSFRIACDGSQPIPPDKQLYAFLRKREFAILDKIDLAKRLGQTPLLLRDVVALDAQDREIGVTQLPIGSSDQTIMLRSPPPTKHDEELEEALISFAANLPGCRVHQVYRGTNKVASRGFHYRLIGMTKGWFEQAHEVESSSDKRL